MVYTATNPTKVSTATKQSTRPQWKPTTKFPKIKVVWPALQAISYQSSRQVIQFITKYWRHLETSCSHQCRSTPPIIHPDGQTYRRNRQFLKPAMIGNNPMMTSHMEERMKAPQHQLQPQHQATSTTSSDTSTVTAPLYDDPTEPYLALYSMPTCTLWISIKTI